MSYDIAFKVKIDSINEWIEVGECDANITYNLREMIVQSTGLEWKNEGDNGLCVDVIPKILHGLNELTAHPSKYIKYEASNGWGTIDGCLGFFQKILHDWDVFSQYKSKTAINAVHFWIE